jgi:methyl-accepting chemotaxis protein
MKLRMDNISLKTKLLGFAGMIFLLVLVTVGVGVFYYSKIESANLIRDKVGNSVEKVLDMRVAEKTFLQFWTPESKTRFVDRVGTVRSSLTGLGQSTTDQGWKQQIATISGAFDAYLKLFDEYVALHGQQNTLREEMVKPLRTSEELLHAIVKDIETKQAQLQMEGESLSPREFGMLGVVKDCRAGFIKLQNVQLQFLISGDQKYTQEYKKLANGNIQSYLTALEQFSASMKNESWMKNAANVRQSLTKFLDQIEQSQRLFDRQNEVGMALDAGGREIVTSANTLMSKVDSAISSEKNQAVRIISGILLGGLLLFSVLCALLVRAITRPINRAIAGLSEVAEQVGASSDQVSHASRELAEDASRQAATVEETSSSLEEMASMTRQNAENAEQANRLMAEAAQTINQANQSMEGLTASMGEISKASEKTQKIIKTIDEVAFQTNLLALNAAVEAARAGEAGAGFAVVADEVRNLARRAADAAKDTANLIETTVKTVKDGAGLVDKTHVEFGRVSQSVSKVGELVGEITAASQEQSQGIGQVNRAVAEIDKVIQKNAANAEQSAAASSEMSVRAEQMKEYVDGLAEMISGGRGGNARKLRTGGKKRGEPEAFAARRTPKAPGMARAEVAVGFTIEDAPLQEQEEPKKSEQRYLHSF